MSPTAIDGISVILPTYNGEKHVASAIRSVLKQDTTTPLEVVVIDDGSSDRTVEIIEDLQDTRIKLVFTSKNIGTAAARNMGIQHATYSWIGFNDHDDIWLPDRIEAQIALLRQHPQLRGVAGGYARLARDGATRWQANLLFKCWSPQHLLPTTDASFYDPAQHGTCYIQTLIVERQLLLDVGGFREDLPIAYDPDIMLRLGEIAALGAVQQAVFLYRLSDDSITSPTRIDTTSFLSGFAYCYQAQAARLRGDTEPDLQAFLKDYVVNEDEVETFTINQALRSINTRWVNGGLISALLGAVQALLMNPLLFTKYTARRLAYWGKSKQS